MAYLYIPPPTVIELAETFAEILARYGVKVSIEIDKGPLGCSTLVVNGLLYEKPIGDK